MNTIKAKLLSSSIGTLLFAFVIVFGIVFLNLSILVSDFLNLSEQRSNEVISNLKKTSESTKEKISKFYEDSLRSKGNNLLDKDLLVIKPPFLENSFTVVKNFLKNAHALDEEIIHASFFVVDDTETKAWQFVDNEYPDGLGLKTIYDNESKSWVTELDGKTLKVLDEKVAEISNTDKKRIELVDFKVTEADGSTRTIKAYDVSIPVYDGTPDEFQEIKEEEGVGFLRYVITLEKMQDALAREETLLASALERRQSENKEAFEVVRDLGLDAQKNSVTILAAAGALILFVCLFINLFIASRISKPVTALTTSAKKIAEGNYDEVIKVMSRDEIGTLGKIFEEMRVKIRDFTENLQHLVDERTKNLNEALHKVTEQKAKIQNILDNIQQGILTFDKSLAIDSEFSRFLSTIYEVDSSQIAGQPIMDVIFSNSVSSPDKINQTYQSILASVGEANISWLLNENNLIEEIEVKIGGKDKILALDWTPVEDDEEITTHIMLSIRDLTEQRALEKQVEKSQAESQRQIKVISELLRVKRQTANDFLKDCMERSDEIKTEMGGERDLGKLYFHLHTIKGSSRVYDFAGITEAAHASEDMISNIRQGKTTDYKSLRDELDTMYTEIDYYYNILNDVLGGAGSASTDDKRPTNLVSLTSNHITKIKKQLETGGCKLSSFVCDDSVLEWRRDKLKIIDNIIMHSLNNASDHGYILPKGKGKEVNSAVFYISARHSTENPGLIHLRLADEGAGFDQEAIKNLAKTKQNRILSNKEEIYSFLLEDEVSTAGQVTKTSGRGVGLSAVKQFVFQNGGTIKLDDNKPQGAEINIYLPAEKFCYGEVPNQVESPEQKRKVSSI